MSLSEMKPLTSLSELTIGIPLTFLSIIVVRASAKVANHANDIGLDEVKKRVNPWLCRRVEHQISKT